MLTKNLCQNNRILEKGKEFERTVTAGYQIVPSHMVAELIGSSSFDFAQDDGLFEEAFLILADAIALKFAEDFIPRAFKRRR